MLILRDFLQVMCWNYQLFFYCVVLIGWEKDSLFKQNETENLTADNKW